MSLRQDLEKQLNKAIDLASKSILVIDRGQFLHIARRLGWDFGRVEYYLEEENPYPSMPIDQIGRGIEEIQVVDDVNKAIERCDCVLYTDVYNGGDPEDLLAKGHNVAGSLKSEVFEVDRRKLKQLLAYAKLPVIPTAYVKGFTDVQKYLSDKTDKYIKTSFYRGDMETYHYENAFLSSTWFLSMKNHLGLCADEMELMIEDPIKGIEPGFESPMVNGELPDKVIVGYEDKDKCYVGSCMPIPQVFRDVHEKMKPAFKKFGYRMWYSTEMRIAEDGTVYYSDATCRFASPASGVYCELDDEFSLGIWRMAHGELHTPKPKAKYGVEVNITSDFADKHGLPLQYPSDIDQWVKLKNCRKEKEGWYCIPNGNQGYIGSVVSLDDNLDTAIENAISMAKTIRGEEIDFDEHGFDGIKESIEKGKGYGIDFGH